MIFLVWSMKLVCTILLYHPL